jgi:D-alanyl-D-alanine dipeptidase
MKKIVAALLMLLVVMAGTASVAKEAVLSDDASGFVLLSEAVPDAILEMRYYSTFNFVGDRIDGYEEPVALLTREAAAALKKVSDDLVSKGYRLKIWDGFRPISAQGALWEAFPNPMYVVNPATGYSSHSRGNTVDVTLTDAEGNDLPMPSDFDEFSAKADQNYYDCTEEVAANARTLQTAMEQAGFQGYYSEWFHYSDTEVYVMQEIFMPLPAKACYAECEDFISLRARPDVTSNVIFQIKKDGEFTVLAEYEDFYLVDYKGLRGYVLKNYAKSVEN